MLKLSIVVRTALPASDRYLVLSFLGQDHLDWHPDLDHIIKTKLAAPDGPTNHRRRGDLALACELDNHGETTSSPAISGLTLTARPSSTKQARPRSAQAWLREHNAQRGLALRAALFQGIDATIAAFV